MWRALAVLVFLLTAVPPALAGDGRTELLAGSCAPCHGADGNSQGASIPSLAGQPQDYFIRAMQAFRKGERAATVMPGSLASRRCC